MDAMTGHSWERRVVSVRDCVTPIRGPGVLRGACPERGRNRDISDRILVSQPNKPSCPFALTPWPEPSKLNERALGPTPGFRRPAPETAYLSLGIKRRIHASLLTPSRSRRRRIRVLDRRGRSGPARDRALRPSRQHAHGLDVRSRRSDAHFHRPARRPDPSRRKRRSPRHPIPQHRSGRGLRR